MVEAKKWILGTKCDGMPKLSDFVCETETVSPCEDGEIIVSAEWFSVDPYQRYRIRASAAGDTVYGSQVARVIESRNPDCPVGTRVVTYPGWRTVSKITKEQTKNPFQFTILPDFGTVKMSAALGVLGMPGNSAYFGFLEVCHPVAGETVVVSGAAGAVGSAVCQIAKIKGCRVIGFAGSQSKVDYLKTLGVDHAFNYKTDDVTASLKQAAPDGVNCYFDNVGGEFTAKVIPHMAVMGRVSVCGAIATYNDEDRASTSMHGEFISAHIITKQLRIEGFLVYRWTARWMEGINQMLEWIKEGKIKYEETVTEGFENMPKAFIGLFRGENTGKAIIKC